MIVKCNLLISVWRCLSVECVLCATSLCVCAFLWVRVCVVCVVCACACAICVWGGVMVYVFL